jgi:hypothetical protein
MDQCLAMALPLNPTLRTSMHLSKAMLCDAIGEMGLTVSFVFCVKRRRESGRQQPRLRTGIVVRVQLEQRTRRYQMKGRSWGMAWDASTTLEGPPT